MAKKKKADALKALVELEQPKVNCGVQDVPTCTESEPGMFNEPEVQASTELDVTATPETQEEPASTKLELCSSVAEPQETADSELEQCPVTDESVESAISESDLIPVADRQETPVNSELGFPS